MIAWLRGEWLNAVSPSIRSLHGANRALAGRVDPIPFLGSMEHPGKDTLAL